MSTFVNNGIRRCKNDYVEYFKYTKLNYDDLHVTVECDSGEYHITLENNNYFPTLELYVIVDGKKVHKYHYGYRNNADRPRFWITNNFNPLYESNMKPDELKLKIKMREVFLIFRKKIKENKLVIPRFNIRSKKTKSVPTPPSIETQKIRKNIEISNSKKKFKNILEKYLKTTKKISKDHFFNFVQFEKKSPTIKRIISDLYNNTVKS